VHRFAVIARDVTQAREAEALQRRLEAQLAEAQKSEALARLAEHIAHDVNNLLTVIAAHAQRLEGQGGRGEEVAGAVLNAVARGRELTQQVLTFGRQRPPERRPVDLGALAQETLRLLQPTVGAVGLVVQVAPGCPKALGDAGQLHQVLTNLCTNAVQAIGGQPGEVRVSVEGIDVDVQASRKEPRLQPGRWVRIAVRDTGVGMDPDTARRAFEPFFSTRGAGNGTGLGLTVVRTIVQAHEGVVLVDSEPGRGSTFSVYLPMAPAPQPTARREQHLMLVDDHPGMARVSARLLETFGYKTSVFDDPRKALEAFTAEPGRFDAILTDLSMPQMSGEELTRQLRAVRPEVPIIASSGLATELDDAARARLGFDAVLVKPWRLEEAIAALERVLTTA
jgi:nitrogen-specific signal transduction histidine kinase/CheY-like chemotaxis protein